jgi:hypothetical protein
MGPYAGADYNLTLCPTHLPWVLGNPMPEIQNRPYPLPESILSPSQGGLCTLYRASAIP